MSQASSPSSSADSSMVPLCAIFRRYLKKQQLKFTPERAMILDAVMAKTGVFEADELLHEMRRANQRVSKATIYRTLKHLVDAKIVSEVLIDAKLAHYELTYGRQPKGHLVCIETNRVVEFAAPELEKLVSRVCKEHGFEPINHRLVIYALCPECAGQLDDETEGE